MIRYIDRSVEQDGKPALPGAILRALLDPSYEENLGEYFDLIPDRIRRVFKTRYSVTTLPRAPRQRVLFVRHSDKIVVDPLANFWKMFGKVKHAILEMFKQPWEITEERLGIILTKDGIYLPTDEELRLRKNSGIYVHGQADLYDPRIAKLADWKVTKAESMLYGEKYEYHAQVNILNFIWRKHGRPVNRIENSFIFRNWDARNIKDGSTYPKEPVLTVEVPMWSDEKCEAYIRTRVKLHEDSNKVEDDKLAFCTDQERWKGQPRYRVLKIDPKTGEQQTKAKFKCDSKIEAQDWCDLDENHYGRLKIGGKVSDQIDRANVIKYVIQEVPAKPSRCGFCDVLPFCGQRQAELKLEFAEEEEV